MTDIRRDSQTKDEPDHDKNISPIVLPDTELSLALLVFSPRTDIDVLSVLLSLRGFMDSKLCIRLVAVSIASASFCLMADTPQDKAPRKRVQSTVGRNVEFLHMDRFTDPDRHPERELELPSEVYVAGVWVPPAYIHLPGRILNEPLRVMQLGAAEVSDHSCTDPLLDSLNSGEMDAAFIGPVITP